MFRTTIHSNVSIVSDAKFHIIDFRGSPVHPNKDIKKRHPLSKAKNDQQSVITLKQCNKGCKLVLFINRKSHGVFRFNSTQLNSTLL